MSNTDIKKYMTFTQTVLYGGNINEAYVETRININGNQKIKSSTALPPYPDCATQVIVRAHYQCYYWVHCVQEIISPIPFQDYGWFFDGQSDVIRPVWFEGDQILSLLAAKSKSRKKKEVNDYEGDVKGECNVKKSKTLKSCKASLLKKEQLQ